MIRFLRNHFARQALTRAEADLAYAKAAYDDAVRRGDTRRQGETWRVLCDARTAVLIAAETFRATRSPRVRSRAVTSSYRLWFP